MLDAQRPAWQTEELEDEWPDDDDDQDFNHDGSSLSFTVPIGSVRVRDEQDGNPFDDDIEHQDNDTGDPVGTFLIRQDAPAAILPKTPGNKKNAIKDFFSPMALERMFEPPSPPKPSASSLNPSAPAVPSRLSQVHVASSFSHDGDTELLVPQSEHPDEIVETDLDNVGAFDGLRPSMDCQFTFAVPRLTPSNALTPNTGVPQAQSTPGPHTANPSAPPTDPRLRLFQFQYDTFTRDHLSAMVDSIAVNTPSASNTGNLTGNASSPFGLSTVSEATAAGSTVDLRSAKRVKLSPVSDFYGEGDGARAVIQRPSLRKDYVGESKSLMAQIKQARDFSTISTVASGSSPAGRIRGNTPSDTTPSPHVESKLRRASHLELPTGSGNSVTETSASSKRDGYSSLGYRQQAANLMAQIKQDMKGSKRLFSAETELSANGEQLLARSDAVPTRLPHPRQLSQSARRFPAPSPERSRSRSPHARDWASLQRLILSEQESSNTSFDTSRIYAQFPAPPILVAPPASPPPREVPSPQPNPVAFHAHANPNPTSALLTVPVDAPVYPSSSIRARANEDLNRFVSSSTASGTTLTAGSSASFVKHPGPAQITRIAPEDVPALPERVGKMVFDKVMMRWVKSTAEATRVVSDGGYAASAEGEGESEDPFRDIESLREEDSERGESGDALREDDHRALEMSRIEEVDDEEEMELTSFSFDGPPQGLVRGEHSSEEGELIVDDDETTDSDHDDELVTQLTDMSLAGPPEIVYEPDSDEDEPSRPPAQFNTPIPSRASSTGPTPIRSVLKSTSTTPLSAARDPLRFAHQTPANRPRHRRSVSFSDGKHEGPIRGLHSEESEADDPDRAHSMLVGTSSFVPSARSKRIAGMMEDLEDTGVDDDSPSKLAAGSGRVPPDELQVFGHRRVSTTFASNANGSAVEVSQRVFTRARSHGVQGNVSKGNATFLTEASFGVAHDKLVEVITDVQPFEPYWEDLTSIDLSRKHLESVARLKEFLPKLHALSLNSNQLSWLSGVPGTVRTLSVAYNALTRATSFNHLLGLENLDISRNNLDGLGQLECLRHLRELRADGNRIRSIDGLQHMDCLVKLSLQENRIGGADFMQCSWPRLEVLNLSHNRIEGVAGVSSLTSLIVLNLDSNSIDEFEAHGIMPRLRILRLSANRLKGLNAGWFPSLRTLYADNNCLTEISKASRMAKLEDLSLRNQGGKGLAFSIREVRDVKRLYLSGNPLPANFLSEPCYNLIYLEIAACRLTALPARLPSLVPNLRVLNLNYNFLEDVRPLEGLRRLNKLTIIGSRLKGTKGLIKVLRGCPDVEMVDFRYGRVFVLLFFSRRMNPCTLGWYLPLLVKDVPGALQPSEPAGSDGGAAPNADPETTAMVSSRARGGSGGPGGAAGSWQELDAKFRRDLPDGAYVGRLAYRGLVMRACGRVRMVDGVVVSRKEREKAERLLEGVVRAGA
ncbi:hypothetical protein BV25DRAFT_1805264 [Artomyces pyxidatus]|uniref:Uncharacterized protein n=1 Tax=Artomyces pyxidatus TaxID=48021 RepID=A0ACB8SYM1_9AGAM|nr:hypothetical protein BV25DRAFT_1805264 [Artomyces pyxidatus]